MRSTPPMKKLAALLGLGVLLLSGAAAGQQTAVAAADAAPTRSLQSVYTVHARGMDVGEFSFNFNQNAATYDVSAQRRATGFARTLLGGQQDYSYAAHGSVAANGALQPVAALCVTVRPTPVTLPSLNGGPDRAPYRRLSLSSNA